VGSGSPKEDEYSRRRAAKSERRNPTNSHPGTPPGLPKDETSVPRTTAALAQPCQTTQYQRLDSTSCAPTASNSPDTQKSYSASSLSSYSKAATAGHPKFKPATRTTATNQQRHRRKGKGPHTGTRMTGWLALALALATTQRKQRRLIRAESSIKEASPRGKGTNGSTDGNYTHAGRNSEIGGSRDRGSVGPGTAGGRGTNSYLETKKWRIQQNLMERA